ncbi:Rhodanese-like domain-containing protein [Triangularia verruculosa]|uniref:Rhodanese-like domain-containing protein n=1 Tax=Triangularia verruculosa TaxID=2587418 RepID=A0AAN7AZE1_9PEZI|nr:Rhodanese-like domain-containing protein [Triangularia verruculosa]
MASHRALTTLLPRAQRAAAPVIRPLATAILSRQYHDQPSLQGPLYKHLLTTTTKPIQSVPSQKRAYSSDPPPTDSPSKIYDFSSVQKLVSSPSPNVTIIDSREPGELQQTGHIPHAINIPVTTSPDSFFIPEEEFEDRFGFPRPSKDQELVFYCKAGVRSRAAAQLARQAGWEKVGEYPGSWLDWFEKGGSVERS